MSMSFSQGTSANVEVVHASEVAVRSGNELFAAVTATATYAAAAFAAGDFEQVVRIANRPPGWRQVADIRREHESSVVPFLGVQATFLMHVGLASLALGERDDAQDALAAASDLLSVVSANVPTYTSEFPCAKHANSVPYGICKEPPCYL